MIFVTLLTAGVTLVLLAPTLVDLWSLARRWTARGTASGASAPEPARILFLVPAHDEELLVGDCVRSVAAMDYPAECRTIVVIADNCSDGTALEAASAGARVLERTDLHHRGKPWALAWAVERIPLGDHDGIVILDADSVVDRGFASALSAAGVHRNAVLQPFNGIANPGDNALTRMAAVLSTAYYRFIYPLRNRGGLNSPLSNGMCIGSAILEEAGWEVFSLAEDTELYVRLTRRGVPIRVVPGAILGSQEARELQQSRVQRTRWRGGRYAILQEGWRDIVGDRRIGPVQRLDLVCELLLPGPVVQSGVALFTALLLLAFRPPFWTLVLGGLALAMTRLFLYTLAAIRAQPSPMRSLAAFAFLPVYLPWRIAIEVLSLRRRAGPWLRTARHGDSPSPNP